jgi:hypothetical protein
MFYSLTSRNGTTERNVISHMLLPVACAVSIVVHVVLINIFHKNPDAHRMKVLLACH